MPRKKTCFFLTVIVRLTQSKKHVLRWL
jgi:hypothetical protein